MSEETSNPDSGGFANADAEARAAAEKAAQDDAEKAAAEKRAQYDAIAAEEAAQDDAAQQHNADPVHSAADTAHTAAVEHLSDAALHGAGVPRDRGGEPPE